MRSSYGAGSDSPPILTFPRAEGEGKEGGDSGAGERILPAMGQTAGPWGAMGTQVPTRSGWLNSLSMARADRYDSLPVRGLLSVGTFSR